MISNYHCSLGQIEPASDKNDYYPFHSASEVTRFTGLPASQWLATHPKGRKPARTPRAKFTSDEIDAIILID